MSDVDSGNVNDWLRHGWPDLKQAREDIVALRAQNAELVAALEASLKYIVRYARCWKKNGVETPANAAALLVEEIDAALAAAADYKAKATEMSEECNKLRTTEPEAVSRQRGADYEAKARDAIKRKFLEATPVPLTGTVSIAYGPPMVIDEEATVAAIAAALAKSAADERRRTIKECAAMVHDGHQPACGYYTGHEAALVSLAKRIAALAEPKGEGK